MGLGRQFLIDVTKRVLALNCLSRSDRPVCRFSYRVFRKSNLLHFRAITVLSPHHIQVARRVKRSEVTHLPTHGVSAGATNSHLSV